MRSAGATQATGPDGADEALEEIVRCRRHGAHREARLGQRLSEQARQRLDDTRPGELVAELGDSRLRVLALIAEQAVDGLDPFVDRFGRDTTARAAVRDEVREHVSAGRHGRQARPEVVQEPGAEGEARLDAVEMGRDPEVGLEQESGTLCVRRPAEVEEDVGVEDAEGLGQLDRAARHLHRGHPGVGMLNAEEEQLHVGPARWRARRPP